MIVAEPWRATLRDAAALLEARGWCRGELFRANGETCLAGAILRVADRDLPPAMAANAANAMAQCRAILRRRLGLAPDIRVSLSEWNDAPERTMADVVALLRDAAEAA